MLNKHKTLTLDQIRAANNVIDDAVQVIELLDKDRKTMDSFLAFGIDPDFWARTGVRTYFADWEARIYQLRRSFVAWGDIGLLDFTQEEMICLRDVSIRVNDEGNVRVSKSKTGTAATFRFVFSMVSKSLQIPNYLKTDGVEWSEFKATIGIRDRLTHPKTTTDLHITSDEAKVLARTVLWVDSVFHRMAADAEPTIKKLLSSSRRRLSKNIKY